MITDWGNITIAPFAVAISSNEAAHGSDYLFNGIPARQADGGGTVLIRKSIKHLCTGDYSIVGFEDQVCVERKTLEDLFGTLGKGRRRFEREVERMRQMQFGAVVIEADFREICRPMDFRPQWRSRLDPRTVWATIFAWSQRFPGIHWFPVGSRRLGEMATWEILERFWRER